MAKKQTAEEILADYEAEQSATKQDEKTAYYRKKKAQDFVQGYITVSKLKADYKGKEVFTQELAVHLLIEQWEDSATLKSEVAI